MKERVRRVNELLRERIAAFVIEHIELEEGVLATVTKVGTAKDLSSAKVWVSVYPEDRRGSTFALLRSATTALHEDLATTLSLYRIPRLTFIVDDAEEKAAHIYNLVSNHLTMTPKLFQCDDSK